MYPRGCLTKCRCLQRSEHARISNILHKRRKMKIYFHIKSHWGKLCLLSKRKKLSFSPSVVNATFSRESFWLTTQKYQYPVYISQQEVNPLQTNGELAYVRCLNGRGTLSRIFWNNSYIWCEHWCLWTRLWLVLVD